MHPMMNIAVKAVRKAGLALLRASENLSSINIYEKSKKNYYTNIDISIESIILRFIQKYYQNHYFLSEESGYLGNEKSEYTWIIDPIDGTNNFIRGNPQHCISIALQRGLSTEIAVIFNPYLDQLFTAIKGSGAQLNGRRIRVSGKNTLSRCLLSSSLSFCKKTFSSSYPEAFMNLQRLSSGFRYSGSLSLDMCYVGSGYLDVVWTVRQTKTWDIAGPILVIKEAGGIVCSLDGGVDLLHHGKLIGGNAFIVKKMLRFFSSYLKKID